MFPFYSEYLSEHVWGPFRLLGAHSVLIGFGAGLAFLLTWRLMLKGVRLIARDRGREFTPNPDAARDKPTGAGFLLVLILLPILALIMPPSPRLWAVVGCLFLAMLTGFLDDRAATPWSETRKGMLDVAVAALTALALSYGRPNTIWLPLVATDPAAPLTVSTPIFVVIATPVLWLSINATNCTDGVDGLAGSLTLLSLFYLGGFLYLVIGHIDMAEYLLVPHNPNGARWAILIFTVCGGLGGYLWHNAKPSAILMGDAGSRFLGLLLGTAVMAAGNPFLILVVAPVVLVNGGTGLVKVLLLRALKRMGMDTTHPSRHERHGERPPVERTVMGVLHMVRFPLHDHCRKNLHWSDSQVLLRFMLIQVFVTPLFLGLLVKLR